MSYVLTGRLQGAVSAHMQEPLSQMTIRLYRVPDGGAPTPAAGSAALSDEDVRDKEYLWMAQARTDERGEFSVDLTERLLHAHRGNTRAYDGGPLQMDVYCRDVPGQQPGSPEEVQFTVVTFLPDWESTAGGQRAHFDHTLPREVWREVRNAMDAWVISGRVASRSNQSPLSGLRVFAFDADLVQDDALGSAVTDEQGNFRIDFPGAAFRETPVKGVNIEGKGPDLYFRIEGPDGSLIIAEDRSRSADPDRKDVENLYSTDLLIDM